METIKLKVLDGPGHTLMTCDAAQEVSLVYTSAYQPGDRIALEIDHPGQFCVVQFEDSMPAALVYVAQREINFHIPFGEQAITYSPKSFTGSRHLIRARLARPDEIAARRNLAFNCYDQHGDPGFYPHASANVETRGEAPLPELGHQSRPQRRSDPRLWPRGAFGRAAPDRAGRLPPRQLLGAGHRQPSPSRTAAGWRSPWSRAPGPRA